jgi:hypothetical protein
LTQARSGSCRSARDCHNTGGYADGSCPASTSQVCCIPTVKCGATILTNNTIFANHNYPNASTAVALCSVKVQLPAHNIRHVKLEFDEFHIAQPNRDGHCEHDKLEVEGLIANIGVLPLCGHNKGQHIHLPVRREQDHIVIKIATSGEFSRKWSIRILFYEDNSPMIPPVGCRKFYTKPEGTTYSFNYDEANRQAYGSISGLRYATCWAKRNGYCRVQITPSYFDLSPQMRQRRAISDRSRRQAEIEANILPLNNRSPCSGLDRVGFPPSVDSQSQTGAGLFCNRSFNNGRPYTIGDDQPLIMYYESGPRHGNGYVLRYRYQIC